MVATWAATMAAGAADGGTVPDGGATPFRVPDGDLRREVLRHGADPRVLFRYRSFAGARPDWVSTGTTTIVHQLGQGVVSTPRGAELSSLLATTFDGVDDGYLGDAAITTQGVGFTLEAWFRPDLLDGYRTLFSNTEGNRGFSLKIVDGRLRVLVRIAEGGGTSSLALFDPEPLQSGTWYSAAAQVTVAAGEVRLRLYRDHVVLVAESTHPALDGIAQSSSRPAVGAEPAAGALSQDWFSGAIYGVQVHNHPVDHDVLATPQLRDGSRYLGAPSYHDYLGSTDSLAVRIARTDRARPDLARVRARLALPLLNDDWVPQGVAISEDGRTAWLSGYSKDADGENADGRASMIAELDLTAPRLRRVFRLVGATGGNLTLHVGGLGALGGNLYIPTNGRVHRLKLADAVLEEAARVQEESGVEGLQPPVYRLAVTETFATRSGGSFLDVDVERHALWVGNFNEAGDPRGTLDRYDLDAEGRIARPSATDSDAHFQLPVDLVQGVVARPGPTLRFLLSTSFGDNPSRLYAWTPGGEAEVIATLPAGLEDLDLAPDGTAWTVFESGARFYQKRPITKGLAWDDLSPHLIGISP